MAGQLQYGGLGAPTRCLCVQRAQRVEETEMDSVELISRTELKHKARNSGGSRNSVTGNGGGKHWSRDRAEAQMPGTVVGAR
jgi:hypothetical protein